MSKSIALYLQLHQPFRMKNYTIFDTSHDHMYFNDDTESKRNNRLIFERICDTSYRPMTALIKKQLDENPDFALTLGMTGTILEQMEAWAPDVLASFQDLIKTGRVEILAETYYHSLAFFYSRAEFERQVNMHREKIESLFGVTPRVFRNSDLAYNNELAQWAEGAGYKGILAEGWDSILDWRSPNHVYSAEGTNGLPLLLKNYRLSDDIALRFGNHTWSEWPLTSHKFSQWVSNNSEGAETINLFMSFDTFGESQPEDTGIFQFFDNFCQNWLKTEGNSFKTVSETIDSYEVRDVISMPHVVSWTDSTRDLSAWTGNGMQNEALRYGYALEDDVLHTEDEELIADWRKLLTSDHTYYMATGGHEDAGVRSYYSPYVSPYDAFLSYINVVRDIRWRISQHRREL